MESQVRSTETKVDSCIAWPHINKACYENFITGFVDVGIAQKK
jgi:hypothetical protein